MQKMYIVTDHSIDPALRITKSIGDLNPYGFEVELPDAFVARYYKVTNQFYRFQNHLRNRCSQGKWVQRPPKQEMAEVQEIRRLQFWLIDQGKYRSLGDMHVLLTGEHLEQ